MSKNFYSFISELFKPKELSSLRTDAKKLTGVDTRETGWKTNLSSYMKKYGFELLGSGKYASVYGNDKYPFVIKVFMKDAAYLKWMNFCLSNRNNPYIPKIKGKVAKIDENVFAIRLEKLKPGSFSGKFANEYNKWLNDKSFVSDDKNIQDIFDNFKKNEKLLDLHSDNIMYRGDQLVIIDPYYNWFGKYEPGQYAIDPNQIDKKLF